MSDSSAFCSNTSTSLFSTSVFKVVALFVVDVVVVTAVVVAAVEVARGTRSVAVVVLLGRLDDSTLAYSPLDDPKNLATSCFRSESSRMANAGRVKCQK